MSQVSSSSGVINTVNSNVNNNSTWNRTPGKPGLGGGGGSVVGNTTNNSNSSINHLPLAVRAAPSALETVVCGPDFSTFDQCDSTDTEPKTSTTCSALAYGDDAFRGHCSTTSVAGGGGADTSSSLTFSDRTDFSAPPIGNSLEPSQMWPPPIFEATENGACNSNNNNVHSSASNFASHPDLAGSGTGQWSISRTNSLFTDPGQANVASGVWSMDATSTVSTSGAAPSLPIPRAITGQLHQSADSLAGQAGRSGGYLPGGAAPQQSAAVGGWSNTNLNESSQLFASDQPTLSSAFSKLNLANPPVQSDCFQPIHDYDDHHLLSSAIPKSDSVLHLGSIGSKGCDKKSSIDGTEVDTLFSPDPEDAIHAIVNTTEAWGTNPIDQSSPWDLTELGGNGSGSCSADASGTQQSLACSPPPSGGNGDALTRNLFEGQPHPVGSTSSMLHQRRITAGSLSGSARGDYESNIWPREPPNGTGIWEAHYESLGERTARWQQGNSANQPQQPVPGHLSSVGTNRSHLTGGTSPSEPYRGFPSRPNTGICTLGHALSASSSSTNRPGIGSGSAGMGQLHLDSLHANGSSRNFPMANSPVMGSSNTAWLRNNPGSGASAAGDPKVGRWPGSSNLGRLSNKQQQPQQQQHSFQSMLSGPSGAPGGNPRWSGGWPPTDPRRGASNVIPLRWSATGGTSASDNVLPAVGGGYYGVPSALHPLLPSPSMPPPPPRGFRPPYPPGQQQQNALFMPTAIGTQSAAQRAGLLSTQQHQLQQQSVLRANAMRQLIGMGFSEDEVQAIFSDLNTNVARALLDLRERTCHSGLDDIIRMFTNANSSNSGFAPISSGDELVVGESAGSLRSISARSGFTMSDQHQQQQPSKVNYMMTTGLPPENIEASLAMLQQRETQILQTIMQLHAKHQELKVAQLRQPNFQFASGVNPVMQELQLQAVQIAQQIEAQQAQLKHVRSQAGMLKQLTIASPSPPPQTTGVGGNQFTAVPPPGGQPWLPNAGAGLAHSMSAFVGSSAGIDLSGVGGGGPMNDLQQQQQQLLQQMSIEAAGAGAFQDQQHHQQPGGGGAGLKMGSGSFLWESGPWSGPGQPSSQDGYSSLGVVGGPMATSAGTMANDRRSWASTNRPQMTGGGGFPSALGSDPRWIMEPPGGAAPDEEYFASAVVSGGGSARHWLLVHNIPPHMSVSVLKTAVASALAKSSSTGGGEQSGGAQMDFELHPNMLARWVLLGLNSAANANLVLEHIDAPGGGGGGHYGCVKAISPMEALQCLQDIQSLACPFKMPTGNTSTTAAPVSGFKFLRSGSVQQQQQQLQPGSQVPFSVSGGGGGGTDFSVSDSPGLFVTSSVCEGGGASVSG